MAHSYRLSPGGKRFMEVARRLVSPTTTAMIEIRARELTIARGGRLVTADDLRDAAEELRKEADHA